MYGHVYPAEVRRKPAPEATRADVRRGRENKEITHRKITTATRPTKPEEYRDHYCPKTEILGDHEIRITALGTGPGLRRRQWR